MNRLLTLFAATACATSTGGAQVALTGTVTPLAPVALRDGAPAVVIGDEAIVLEAAILAVGPVYLWSLPPDLDGDAWARALAPIPRAHADDQVNGGRLVGEIPHQLRIDLLRDGTRPLGAGTGVAGAAGSADVWLEPLAAAPTLTVAGTARSGEEMLPFEAEITWAAPWLDEEGGVNATLLRRVRGLPADLTLRDGMVLDVGVDVRRWFAEDFVAALAEVPPDPDGVRRLGPEDRAGRSLDQAVRRIGATGPWRISEGNLTE
jgi:hypothetical protein